MPRKFSQKIAVLTLIFSASCINKYDNFILSDVSSIQRSELSDHHVCSALHHSMDNFTTINSAIYWRCRLAITKTKLSPTNTSSSDLEHNLKIGDLIRRIYLKLQETPEEAMLYSNKKMDDRQHKKCLKMGFELDTNDQIKVDNYFSCRKILIEEQQMIPPFGNADYVPYLNHSYNLSYVVNRRLDNENKKHEEHKKKYPDCLKFNAYSADFKNCKEAMDRSRQCYSDIAKKRADKELNERLNCQRRAYIEFTDDMMREEDRRSWEIEKENAKADYDNKLNFIGIGIQDLSQFGVSNEKPEKIQKEPKLKNSKEGLYTKVELATLRRKYVMSCNKDADKKILDYLMNLNVDCKKLQEFKLEGEE